MRGHLLGGRGSLLEDPELGLGFVLEVLAVPENLTSLDKRDRLPQTLEFPALCPLHPGLKYLGENIVLEKNIVNDLNNFESP